MSTTPAPLGERELDRLRAMADGLDCLTEHDLVLLAGITTSTAESWRRRGTGPSYVRIGNRIFYQRKAVAQYMEDRVRDSIAPNARGSL
ncbi:MAG: helix-turn-helix transcriptional regulator [Janthinobacterium lividum]